MADRVRHDNASIRTVRGRLVRRGATRRPAVTVPDGDQDVLPGGETIRLVIGGNERRSPVAERETGPIIAGAYDNARLARDRDGPDRLAEWVETEGIEFGRSVLLDVVEPGEVYGLRLPGEDAVYDVDRTPNESLRRIAEDLGS